MERVNTLNERLQDQLKSGAKISELLMTVQMIQAELLHLQSNSPTNSSHTIAFEIINPELKLGSEIKENTGSDLMQEKNIPVEKVPEEKVIYTLDIDEKIVEEELEQIKKNAEAKNATSIKNKPLIQFDSVEEIPTLMHQRTEVKQSNANASVGNQTTSLNDRLRQESAERSETLSTTPIKELKKAIGVNDRFVFINELFQGDEVMYERSLKTIDAFKIYPEAEFWIRRELKLKLGWDEKSESVKYFTHLVKRRFDFT
jgi:hypothetical protein